MMRLDAVQACLAPNDAPLLDSSRTGHLDRTNCHVLTSISSFLHRFPARANEPFVPISVWQSDPTTTSSLAQKPSMSSLKFV